MPCITIKLVQLQKTNAVGSKPVASVSANYANKNTPVSFELEEQRQGVTFTCLHVCDWDINTYLCWDDGSTMAFDSGEYVAI